MTFELNEENHFLQQEYKKENYIIQDIDKNNHSCIIFFSGNGLYFPNEIEVFQHQIQINNRYEWRKTAYSSEIRKKYGKIILIRNIYKNWYLNGINEELNTIDKLAEFLKKETDDNEVTVVGNSAGGFAALLLGNLIGAKAIFSFSGQNNLWNHRAMQEYWVEKYKDDITINKYYDATAFMVDDIPVFYFMPNGSAEDVEQAKNFQGYSNVYKFDVNSSNHGTTLVSENYKYILIKEIEELILLYKKYKGKKINPLLFYEHTGGVEGKKYFIIYQLNAIHRNLIKMWKKLKGFVRKKNVCDKCPFNSK